MHESFSVGRVAGVRVGANWSVLVVVWLIAWSLADSYLPDTAPGHGTATYWIAGVVAALTFFACLLAHELAHALMARRFDIGIEGIVLWLFGGVSKFSGDPPSAGAELRVAAAGPITSAAIALGFFGTTRLIDSIADAPALSATLGWLGWINASLAVFNLVPAFPLDGGRVLRAALWARHGDKRRATSTAVDAGRFFAYLLIALGLLQFLAGIALSGLWLVFLGWFLLAAAAGESSQSFLNSTLEGTAVQMAMTPNPVVVPMDTLIDALIEEWLFTQRCSTFPLVDGSDDVTGLITIARIKKVPIERRSTTRAIDVAARGDEIVGCEIGDPLTTVIERMGRSVDQRALVFDRGTLVGIVSPSDVTRILDNLGLAGPADRREVNRN